MAEWAERDVPDQRGRVAVVTGGSNGIGFGVARALARKGALVVLACEHLGRARDAVARIDGRVEVLKLDLASLTSVRAAADELIGRHERVDLLVNSAGVVGAGTTEDGFTARFGVNHLGHYAFTGLVLEWMLRVPRARVVSLASIAHRIGRFDAADPRATGTYGGSKLASLLFTLELDRRLRGTSVSALAAHPGGVATAFFRDSTTPMHRPVAVVGKILAHGSAQGALPVLRAATDPVARGGEHYGPGGPFQLVGSPRPVPVAARARDEDAQRGLWELSERLTGVRFPV
ncbi:MULTISPECIES: oxidoreductase [Actinosynnema]|uniref:oxidoreductase n=1 Tax=Actinosynnema TaxID=40566 RepID=UPI0020A46F8E|nr:oxidoreductase [Actinosynnema pretiosum]MCP2092393.1 Short-chain dehydrogenase [Actinosynnema pretiosum]